MSVRYTFVLPDMSWLFDYKAQFSLGVLYVTTSLQEVECDVSLYDTNIYPIEDIPYSDVFCFFAVYVTYNNCVLLAKAIRKKHPSSCIIIGGVHPTLSSETIDPVFDSVFVGQAENLIKQHVRDFKNNIKRSKYVENNPVDINKILPSREWLPEEYIRSGSVFSGRLSLSQGGSTSIMLSRGCPFNCAFCSSTALHRRKTSFRSVSSVQEEVQYLKNRFGIYQYRVQDDTFTLNKQNFLAIAEMLKKEEIYYRCSTRIDTIDAQITDALWESGCREIGLGIEVADNAILEKLNKKITVEKAREAIYLLKTKPFKIRLFFLIGLPFDSFQTMDQNIKFIEEMKPDGVTVGNFIPFPGSLMHDAKKQYGIAGIKKNGCMNISPAHFPSPNIYRLDKTETEHEEIMKTFYFYLKSRGYI